MTVQELGNKDLSELKEWAQSRIDDIEADERFGYPPAKVEVNAPLALIQVQLKAEHRILKIIIEGVPA